MNVVLVGHVLLFAGSALLCLGSIPQARTIQHPGTREGLVGFLLAVALWSGGYVGYLLAPTDPSRLAFYVLGFVFAFVAVGAWLYFCAAYTGRPPRQAPFRNAAVAGFLGVIALKVTNPLHGLYFTTEWTTEPFPHLAIHHGLLYWVLLGLSYAAIAVGFFMLVERLYHTGTDSRPLLLLAGLTGVPAVATIFGGQIEWLLPLMYEPPGVALFAAGTLFVYKRRLETIRVTSETDKPAVFLDAEGQIRDYNQAALAVFPALENSIGTPIGDVNSDLADHLSGQGVISMTRADDTRLYEVTSSPFTSGEVTTGQLLTLADVTDRESYRQQLEVKTEQLEALNRVVRHDIRNDMTVILGWGEMLEEYVTPKGEEALDRVLEKSRHVVELTDLSRDFVTSLSGDGDVELKPIAVDRVLDAELAAVRESFPDADFRVSGEIPSVSVRANEMLSSVFRNLLENAVRHSDEPTPEVTVTCVADAETVRVRVADNGPGIPDAQKERLFREGVRGPESTGSGIGLYLVHSLTEQFGGEVRIEDNDPKGTIFVVELQQAD